MLIVEGRYPMTKLPPVTIARARRLYRAQHAIWLWLGLASVVSLVAWYLDPSGEAQRSAIGHELRSGVDDLWHLLLGVGGGAVFYGVWWMRVRAEIIGHLFIGIAVAINAVAVTTVTGVTSTAFVLYGVGCANAFRIWFLVVTSEPR